MLNDLRFALRTFARQPSYAFAAVATLALGIAVNTVAFTAVDALVLRPMPVPDASRVVRAYPVEVSGRRMNLFSYPDYLDYRAAATAFETLAGYIPSDVTSGRSSLDRGTVAPRAALAYVVSADYFDLTGVRAAFGRVLRPGDERRDTHSVVLGQTFWRTRFDANPSAIGATIALNGTTFTIVGVAVAGFAGTEPLVADCWIPLTDLPITTGAAQRPLDRATDMLLVAGRLKSGVSRASAAGQMSLESARLALAYPGRVRPASVTLESGTFFTLDPGLKPIIGGSLAVVALVLFIACANAANLALARMASRRREMALRLALGASRGRIVRQLLVESMTIALAAGVLALIAAEWALRALYRIGVSLAATPWAVSLNLAPDVRVFAWTSSIAFLAGAALGLLPALQSSSGRLAGALHGLGLFGGRIRGATLRHALVIVQVAASLVLLFGAGLLLRALVSAQALDLGFKTSGVVYTDYDPAAARYTAARADALNRGLLDSARSMPGVTAAALTSHVPLHGGVRWTVVRLIGTRTLIETPHAIVSSVSPEYFAALQIPFIEGRGFTDAPTAPSVIISEGLAHRFWPGESAIGRSLTAGESLQPRTVIGVVRDAANGAIWRDKETAIYLPIDGSTDPRELRILVRTTGVPGVARLLAARAAALDPDLRFAPVPLDELLRLWRLPSKVAAASLGVLAVMALTLACVGVYGVMSFAVNQRMREIGIRMALGADARRIVTMILREGWRLVAVGLVAGGVCAVPAAPLLGRLLFDVSAFDPLTMAVVPSLLSVVALGACYLPARRASRLQPLAVLRVE